MFLDSNVLLLVWVIALSVFGFAGSIYNKCYYTNGTWVYISPSIPLYKFVVYTTTFIAAFIYLGVSFI